MDNEQDILHEAVQALQALPGLTVSGIESADGRDVVLCVDGRQHPFTVEVKRSLTKSQAGVLLSQVPQAPHPRLVVADHISGTVAELLRDRSTCYLDTAGNCYLHHGPLFVLVEGRKSRHGRRTEPVRAFQDAGLRLIFLLLLDTTKANCTYRELSEMTGISRGAVGYVMSDLADLGYVVDVGHGRRTLQKREELIEKWVASYGEILRPKLVRGRFRFKDEEHRRRWRDISLEAVNGVWGGEPAASVITDYLRPEIFSIYTDAPKSQIVQATRLLPDPEGPVEVLGRFWNEEVVTPYLPPLDYRSAPPLLVYADLVASAIPRNLDTARVLYKGELAT